jgi:predicted Zn-dependent protease
MTTTLEVPFKGRTYIWDGKVFYGADDYTTPPLGILLQLRALLADHLIAEDDEITDRDRLLERAKEARELKEYRRAERLVRRVLNESPRDPGVASVLCSILREACKPQESLALADRYLDTRYPPLMTTRAAALGDLGRWEEALEQIEKVLELEKSQPARLVYDRIATQAPHLFEEETPTPRPTRKPSRRRAVRV